MQFQKIDFATPEYDLAVRLRTEVLRRPLGLEFTVEQLEKEWADDHFAAFDERGQLVGCLILTKKDSKSVKMRQVAVAPDRQKTGIGQFLVAHSEVWAARKGFEKMELSAREPAVPFYEKLGYARVGERFEEVSIPHFRMEKRLVAAAS